MIWLPETQPRPPPFLPNRMQCPGNTFITWNSMLHWELPTWLPIALPPPPRFSANSEIPELCGSDDIGGCPAAVLGSVAAATVGGSSSRIISMIWDPCVELTESSTTSITIFTTVTAVNAYGLPRNWHVILFKSQLYFHQNETRKWWFSNWPVDVSAFRFYMIFSSIIQIKEAFQSKHINYIQLDWENRVGIPYNV